MMHMTGAGAEGCQKPDARHQKQVATWTPYAAQGPLRDDSFNSQVIRIRFRSAPRQAALPGMPVLMDNNGKDNDKNNDHGF